MAEAELNPRKMRILLLNPNSSDAMSNGMAIAARSTHISNSIQIDSYTAPPSAPASIDNDKDISDSTEQVLHDLYAKQHLSLRDYDAVLVACFSVHSLVPELLKDKDRVVMGIFEASILTALSIISSPPKPTQWGIVTTGEFWKKHLADGVRDFLGQDTSAANKKFAGVYSTGLNAGDFHIVSEKEVQKRLGKATRDLLQSGNVKCVVMGCGGMAGLEDIIRSVAVEVYGEERAAELYIIDGVKAGIMQLHQAVNGKRAFGRSC